ncbi:MAG TPA: hypothetical protein VES67_12455 [Vicinamibacterales bacterium]|nr:hypothetical protein [Vicinamibacterales bacterium]
MFRILLVAGLMVMAPLTVALDGQSLPDFSGKWTAVSPTISYPPNRSMTITQDGTTLTVDSTAFRVTASTAGWSSETSYPMRTIYILDGTEHPSQIVADPPPWPQSLKAMTTTLHESISKATWAGRHLVIMTYEKQRTTAPGRTPAFAETRRTVREAISLEADGALVWESLIVADPLPWGRAVATPTPFRRIYRKS